MPHDMHGAPLAAGDVVTLTCQVMDVTDVKTACNVCVQVIRPAGCDEKYPPVVSLNSKLVEKIPAEPDPPVRIT